MPSLRPVAVLIALTALPLATRAEVPPLADRTSSAQARPVPAPPEVAVQWGRLVGTWITDNGEYKNENDPNDAFGLEWTWGVGRRSLVGRLYGIVDGKETVTFWQFREFWHPGTATLVLTQFSGGGAYGEGPHTVQPDGTSEMVQTFYDPVAGTTTKVGHRSTLDGDVHTTTSFDVDARGTWTPRRTYTWHRQAGRQP